MIEQLFGSKTRVKLLQLFFSNPNRSFYVREITRKIDEQINSVRRELANLLSIGLIVSDSNNNRLYYEVNQKYKYFDPLRTIFGESELSEGDTAEVETASEPEAAQPAVKKIAVTTNNPMARELRNLGKIDLALLTGQFTRDSRPGIDMLLVGDLNQSKTTRFMEELEAQERKSIAYTIMPVAEYNYRLQINDRFLTNVIAAKKQVIINDSNLRVDL